jgi:hypothetical protein
MLERGTTNEGSGVVEADEQSRHISEEGQTKNN